MLRRVALVRTDVSEEPSASFVRVTRIGELGTTLAITSNRRTLRSSVTSQKTLFVIVTAVKTSNLIGWIESVRETYTVLLFPDIIRGMEWSRMEYAMSCGTSGYCVILIKHTWENMKRAHHLSDSGGGGGGTRNCDNSETDLHETVDTARGRTRLPWERNRQRTFATMTMNHGLP
jgi:hypothetical protein